MSSWSGTTKLCYKKRGEGSKNFYVLNKSTILFGTEPIATLGCIWPVGWGLDSPRRGREGWPGGRMVGGTAHSWGTQCLLTTWWSCLQEVKRLVLPWRKPLATGSVQGTLRSHPMRGWARCLLSKTNVTLWSHFSSCFSLSLSLLMIILIINNHTRITALILIVLIINFFCYFNSYSSFMFN